MEAGNDISWPVTFWRGLHFSIIHCDRLVAFETVEDGSNAGKNEQICPPKKSSIGWLELLPCRDFYQLLIKTESCEI